MELVLREGQTEEGTGDNPTRAAPPRQEVWTEETRCQRSDDEQDDVNMTTATSTTVVVPAGPSQTPVTRAISSVSKASSSISSISEHACRICWLGDEKEACIRPCKCSGSSAYIHPSCLRKWLHMANDYHCEICMFRYRTKRRMKPLTKWRWWPNDSRSLSQLEATIILLGIVTPPLICGIILCAQKVAEYIDSDYETWKVAALLTLIIASTSTYLAAITFFCVKFGLVCKMWIARNHIMVISVGDMEVIVESKLPCGEAIDVGESAPARLPPPVEVLPVTATTSSPAAPIDVTVVNEQRPRDNETNGQVNSQRTDRDVNIWAIT